MYTDAGDIQKLAAAMSTKALPSSIEHGEAKISEARNDLDYILLVGQGGYCIGKLHHCTSRRHAWCAYDTRSIQVVENWTMCIWSNLILHGDTKKIGSRLFAGPSDSELLSVQSRHNRRRACSWTVEAGVILQSNTDHLKSFPILTGELKGHLCQGRQSCKAHRC